MEFGVQNATWSKEVIKFESIIVDNTNNYDTKNGSFLVPISGKLKNSVHSVMYIIFICFNKASVHA